MEIRTGLTFFRMLKTDLIKYYRKTFWDDLVNKSIWIGSVLIISTYIWPHVGMSEQFGLFMAIGSLVSCSFWDAWGVTAQFVSDLTGSREIDYYITLPIPSWVFFIKQMVFYTVRSMASSWIMIPLSKLILGARLDLWSISYYKFILIFIMTNIFCSTLSLLMTSLVKNMDTIDNVSVRFLFPMWFFGGSQFSWMTFYAAAPLFAYLNLCNPLVYAMEAMHVAFLGQEHYLPFWVCILMLCVFSGICGYIGTRRLIRQLDCVRS